MDICIARHIRGWIYSIECIWIRQDTGASAHPRSLCISPYLAFVQIYWPHFSVVVHGVILGEVIGSIIRAVSHSIIRLYCAQLKSCSALISSRCGPCAPAGNTGRLAGCAGRFHGTPNVAVYSAGLKVRPRSPLFGAPRVKLFTDAAFALSCSSVFKTASREGLWPGAWKRDKGLCGHVSGTESFIIIGDYLSSIFVGNGIVGGYVGCTVDGFLRLSSQGRVSPKVC